MIDFEHFSLPYYAVELIKILTVDIYFHCVLHEEIVISKEGICLMTYH